MRNGAAGRRIRIVTEDSRELGTDGFRLTSKGDVIKNRAFGAKLRVNGYNHTPNDVPDALGGDDFRFVNAVAERVEKVHPDVFIETLARFEMDGFAHGAATADYALKLMKDLPAEPFVLAANYVSGETFPF